MKLEGEPCQTCPTSIGSVDGSPTMLEASAIYDIAKRRTRIPLIMTQIYPSLSGEKPCLQVQPHKYGHRVRTNIKKLTAFEFTNPIC